MRFFAPVFLVLLLMTVSFSVAGAAEKKAESKVRPAMVDVNKDGSISVTESQTLAQSQFRMYDRDLDGMITLEEYRVPFNALAKVKKYDAVRKAAEEKYVDESFSRIDASKDSKIDKDEFLRDAALRHRMMDGNHDGLVTEKEIESLRKKIETAHKEAVKKE